MLHVSSSTIVGRLSVLQVPVPTMEGRLSVLHVPVLTKGGEAVCAACPCSHQRREGTLRIILSSLPKRKRTLSAPHSLPIVHT